MTHLSHKAWFGGFIAVFLATSAMAGPPTIHDGNRTYGNSMGGNRCDTFDNLYRCVDVYAYENYDVKGTFQYTEVMISLYTHRSFDDGSWIERWRQLSCPVDESAITVRPNAVFLEAVLDPNAPGCYSDGQQVTWDPINGYTFAPAAWTEPRPVRGEWLDPMSYSKSVSTRRDSFYDGWSDTDNTAVNHCNESYGDLMKAGGFSLGIADRWYAFEGIDTPGWSFFQTMSCNANNMQK
jgi:hypothetical protein